MATEIIMPKVDMDQETGTITEWLKNEGDRVETGEVILIIETDKVAIEVESPGSGILTGITAHAGVKVPIATVIGYLLEPGEELPSVAQATAQPPQEQATTAIPVETPNAAVATPVARNMADALGIELAQVTGTGVGGKITRADVEATLNNGAKDHDRHNGHIYATPAARHLAREQNVDLHVTVGSGPDGRIQAADVVTAAASRAERVITESPVSPVGREEVEIIPLQGMRRTIAERLTASYQNAPHIIFTARVDMTQLDAARASLNEYGETVGDVRISATAMIVKAVALALTRHPYLNCALHGDEIHLYRDVNVGVAVALEQGLVVPVVHRAPQKGIVEIAGEVRDLAVRARGGQLQPSDVSGGTFTISNLGPFGVEQFTAIINPPQSAILAVGVTQLEAVPDETGNILARPIMRMTLSADHRVVDGAVAAHFIGDLKAMLENPTLLLR